MKILITEKQVKRLLEHNKLAQDEFIKRSQLVHKNEDGSPKYDYSLVDFVDTNTKVKVVCPEHKDQLLQDTGQEYFEVFPNTHMQGKGICPYESKRKLTKHSDEHLAKIASLVNSSIEFKTKYPSEYFAARKRKKNDPEFYKRITSHFQSMIRKSYGEEAVFQTLEELGYKFKIQHSFKDCTNMKEKRYCRYLPFDFYIPTLNTAIEYDGEQHFKESNLFGPEKFLATQRNDKLKDLFCNKNDINLIRIHYKFGEIPEDLEEILNDIKNHNFKGLFYKLGPY